MTLDLLAEVLKLMIEADLKRHCHGNGRGADRLLCDALRLLDPSTPLPDPNSKGRYQNRSYTSRPANSKPEDHQRFDDTNHSDWKQLRQHSTQKPDYDKPDF